MARGGHSPHAASWLTLTMATASLLGVVAVVLAVPHREHVHSRLALILSLPVLALALIGWLMGPR